MKSNRLLYLAALMTLSMNACGGGESSEDEKPCDGVCTENQKCNENTNMCEDLEDPHKGQKACLTDLDCAGGECVDGFCKVECVADADCGADKVCNANHCEVKPECVTDADCGADKVCNANHCELKLECVTDADCGNDEVCNANHCEVKPECAVDADCGDGKLCKAQKCLAIECMQSKDCKAGMVCIDRLCEEDPLKCETNDDCETGLSCLNKRCKDPDHECDTLDDCVGTLVCSADYKCVPECEVSDDCLGDYICVNKQCKPECVRNSDCAEPAWCNVNRCTTACSTNDDCPGSNVCKEGTCAPECTADSDCASPLVCNKNRCVECVSNDQCTGSDVCLENRCQEAKTQRHVCIITKDGDKVYGTGEDYVLPKNADGSISICQIGYKPSKAEIELGESDACVPLFKGRAWDFMGDGVDSNCDGYDYDLSKSIFVDAYGEADIEGHDAHKGKYDEASKMVKPLATVSAALTRSVYSLVVDGNLYLLYPDIIVSDKAEEALLKSLVVPSVSPTSVAELTHLDVLDDDASLTAFAYHQKLIQERSKSDVVIDAVNYGWIREGDVPKAGIRIFGGMVRSETENTLWVHEPGVVTKQKMVVEASSAPYHAMIQAKDVMEPLSVALSHFDMQMSASDRSPWEGTTLIGLTCSYAGCRDVVLNDVKMSIIAPSGLDRGAAEHSGDKGNDGYNGAFAQDDAYVRYNESTMCTIPQTYSTVAGGRGGCAGYGNTKTEVLSEPQGGDGEAGTSVRDGSTVISAGGAAGGSNAVTVRRDTGCDTSTTINANYIGKDGQAGANGRNGSKASLAWKLALSSDDRAVYWESNYNSAKGIHGLDGAGGGGGGGGSAYHLYKSRIDHSWVVGGTGGNGGGGGIGGKAGGTGGSAVGMVLTSMATGASHIVLNDTKILVQAGSGGTAQSGSNGGAGGCGGKGEARAIEGPFNVDLLCVKAGGGGNGGCGGGGGAGAGGMAGIATAFTMVCTRNATEDCSAASDTQPCFTSNNRYTLANCGFELPATLVDRSGDEKFTTVEAGYSYDDVETSESCVGGKASTNKTQGNSSVITTWIGS